MKRHTRSSNKFFRSRRGITVLVAVVLVCGLGIWRVSAHGRTPLPVLMYHHVEADGTECNDMTVTESRLEKDFCWLRDRGYHPVLPRELAEGDPLPEKPILITFDDGYRSNYDLLYPLLQKYQMKAVISIIVEMPELPADNFLTWDMCREMDGSGLVEIGSHSFALHNLGDLGGCFDPSGVNGIERRPDETDEAFQTRVLDDIQESYDLIEQKVGQAPTFFAYPFGLKEPDAEELVNRLFPVTAVTKPKIADLKRGLHDLPRITVTMNRELSSVLK
ncbi:polysaccharide deacetylase family protein [Oscillibacter sp.]|uniref:polysaccharide deacetylase family protein n=1 Tax=Oscillibacter sp. TaxID=1945593 RepID=UPI0028AEAAAC|nr:polysaccharide deacetylase family protein [Oscillibacter sp.]